MVLTAVFTPLWSNMYLLFTEKEYEIPQESSVFTFEATKMNEGSGGWWIYGEDSKNYYALTNDTVNRIISINKKQAVKINDFNKLDYKTWTVKK